MMSDSRARWLRYWPSPLVIGVACLLTIVFTVANSDGAAGQGLIELRFTDPLSGEGVDQLVLPSVGSTADVDVSVTGLNADDADSLQLRLDFDTTKLSLESCELAGIFSGALSAGPVESSPLFRTVFCGLENGPTAGEGVAITLTFERLDSFSGGEVPVAMSATTPFQTSFFEDGAAISIDTLDSLAAVIVANDPPSADDDGYSVDEDAVLNVAEPGVLDGDTDGDGDPLTAVLNTDVSNGTLALSPNGSFTYTPDPDFSGADSFTYQAHDGISPSNVATVAITVNPLPDPPVAHDQSVSTIQDTALPITLTGSDPDGDLLIFAVTSQPSNGTLSGTEPNLTYTPDPGFTGTASFTFDASDVTLPSNEATVTIDVTSTSNSQITLFYGGDQQFNNVGRPQTWVDILGNASDPEGLASLTFSLNGGPQRLMTIGPDGRRLENLGDFNAQFLFDDLVVGTNIVVISATDSDGYVTEKAVALDYPGNNTWPLTYSIDWDTVTDVQDAVQVVDGEWVIGPNGITNGSNTGYDRLFAVGNVDWTDFTVTFPLTVHGYNPAGYMCCGVGVILRWQGHTDDPVVCSQPKCGWQPYGNEMWYEWDASGGHSSQFAGNSRSLTDTTGPVLQIDVTYMFKLEVETIGGENYYRKKVWVQGQPEPEAWLVEEIRNNNSLDSGSLLFVSHHTEVTVGDVVITPLGGIPNDPPVAVDNGYVVDEDAVLNVAAPGVLGNDTDGNGDPLSAVLDTDVSNGTLVLNADGSFTYTPNADFNGADSFTYVADDGVDTSNVATVTITVNASDTGGGGGAPPPQPAPTPATTAPGTVLNPTAEPGDHQVRLSWDPPASNGGSQITSYRVFVVEEGRSFVIGGSATTTVVTGLQNGVPRSFQVNAGNVNGFGPTSAVIGPVTPAGPAGPPLNFAVSVNETSASAELSWLAPSDNGGSPVTEYIVTDANSNIDPVHVQPSQNTVIVTGLLPNTEYRFEVAAVTVAGQGTNATADSVTLISATATPPVSSAPGDPEPGSGNGSVFGKFKDKLQALKEDIDGVAGQLSNALGSAVQTVEGALEISSGGNAITVSLPVTVDGENTSFDGAVDIHMDDLDISTLGGEGTGKLNLSDDLSLTGQVALKRNGNSVAVEFTNATLSYSPTVIASDALGDIKAGVGFNVRVDSLPGEGSFSTTVMGPESDLALDIGVAFSLAASAGDPGIGNAGTDIAYVVQVEKQGLVTEGFGDNTVTMTVSAAWYLSRLSEGKSVSIIKRDDGGDIHSRVASCEVQGDAVTCTAVFDGDAGGFSDFALSALTAAAPTPSATATISVSTATPVPSATLTPTVPATAAPSQTALPVLNPTPVPTTGLFPTDTPDEPNGSRWWVWLIVIGLPVMVVAAAAYFQARRRRLGST